MAKWKIVLAILNKIIFLFCVSQVQITCVIHSMHIYCNVITISMITYSRLLALLQLYIVRTNIVSLVWMLNCGWNMTSRNDRFKWTNDEIGFNAAKWDLPPTSRFKVIWYFWDLIVWINNFLCVSMLNLICIIHGMIGLNDPMMKQGSMGQDKNSGQ